MRKRIPKEYLGAFKSGHRKAVRDFIDEELALELLEKVEQGSEEAKRALAWLTQFNNEYHKAVIKRGDQEAFHKTPEEIKQCDHRKYATQNDIFLHLNKTKKKGDEP